MPTIDIPNIRINKVEIHEIPVWKTDIQTLNNISKPIVDIPGCVRVHRIILKVLLIVIKMNTAHIQNVVISVFLVLNLYSTTQRICIYAIRNPPKSGTRICPTYSRTSKIRTKKEKR